MADVIFSNGDIGNLYNGLNNTTLNTNDVLIKQKEMINIVDSEKQRLHEKKQNVDNALEGQNRLIMMNNSYRLRYTDYTKMLVILTVSFFIFVLATLAKKYIPFFPEALYNIIVIILVPVTMIMIYYKYVNIVNHNKLNYDELEFKPPIMLSADERLKEEVSRKTDILKTGNLLGGLEGCIGAQCCSGNTIWDSGNSVCVAPVTSGFTTIDYALLNGEVQFKILDNNGIKPNSPNEFDRYTRI